MSEKNINWSVVIGKIIPIPIVSIILTLLTIYIFNTPTGSQYFTYMVKGISIDLPLLIYIVVLQFIVASIMYLIVKFRKVRAAKLGFYLMSTTFSFFSIFSILYAIFSIFTIPDTYIYTILTISIILTLIFVKMMRSDNHIIKYIAFFIVCTLASLDLIIYLYPSIIFLIILLMPIMDIVLVYYGPLGKSIQEVKKRISKVEESYQKVSTYSRFRESSDIVTKLTVRLDGIMLGIGDFLLYSLSTMWSIELITGVLNIVQLVTYLAIYIILFTLSFYVNIKLCLKKGYGPATPLPLATCIVLTLLTYYLFTLK